MADVARRVAVDYHVVDHSAACDAVAELPLIGQHTTHTRQATYNVDGIHHAVHHTVRHGRVRRRLPMRMRTRAAHACLSALEG